MKKKKKYVCFGAMVLCGILVMGGCAKENNANEGVGDLHDNISVQEEQRGSEQQEQSEGAQQEQSGNEQQEQGGSTQGEQKENTQSEKSTDEQSQQSTKAVPSSGDSSGYNSEVELTYEEMMDKFYETYYEGLSFEDIEAAAIEGNACYHESAYYSEVTNYWENVREVRDIASLIEPLYFTDMKYYTEQDFKDDPAVIIHLAKNEIYARHGYIFKDEDLNNYFKGCAWYHPLYNSDEFDDSIFNEYEKKNLELLIELDSQ